MTETPNFKKNRPIKVLFICMGNMCRSPLAEGVFSSLVESNNLGHTISTDSAGTHFYHVGEPPDPRSQLVAQKYSVDISGQRCRQVTQEDFRVFDYILAMDNQNIRQLQNIQPENARATVSLFLTYAENRETLEVPDPYFGGNDGFEHVYALVKKASEGLLQHIKNAHVLLS
jgi:protein-tyrosine phosphatase